MASPSSSKNPPKSPTNSSLQSAEKTPLASRKRSGKSPSIRKTIGKETAQSLKNTSEASSSEVIKGGTSSLTPSNNLPPTSTPAPVSANTTEASSSEVIRDGTSSLTPSNNLPPAPVVANAPPAAEVPTPQAVAKIQAVFYAIITVALVFLKSPDRIQDNMPYDQPMLNYQRVSPDISSRLACALDIILLFLGFAYGASQILADMFRFQDYHMYDIASVCMGAVLVTCLMFMFSIYCGVVVLVAGVFLLVLVHKRV